VVLLCFIALGAVSGAAAGHRADRDCRSQLQHNARIEFAGQPASLPGDDGGFTLVLSGADCTGSVHAKLPRGTALALRDGRALAGTGVWLAYESRSRLPVLPERRGMLSIRSVHEAPAAAVHVSRALQLRTRAQRVLRATLRQSGLAEALVLAQRDGVDREVRDRFAATGLAHLLSISGTHVGLVAALLLGLAAFLRRSGHAGRVGATAGVVAYVLFLGAPAAAARSAIQVLLLLAGRMLQRPADPYTALAGAALLLLIAQPLNLLDAGFQLSFAGVLGLIAYRRRVAERLPRRIPRWVRDGLAASIAASAATLPIAALHFGQVAPIGVVASIIAVPLVGFALPAVALILLVAPVSMPAARFLGAGTDVLLDGVDRVAAVAAAVPGGHAPLSWMSLMSLLLVTAAAIVACAWQRGGRRAQRARDTQRVPNVRPRLRAGMVGAAAIAVFAWTPQLRALHGDAVEIHAIDVGQGDALAIRTPHGHWVLVDAGPRTATYDAGRRRVVPYLSAHGVSGLDAVVITHPDADHIGGVAAVLEMLGAQAVIDPGTAAGKPLYLQTMATADSGHIIWFKARDGRHLDVDGVRLDFLYPASDSLDGTGDPNDLSVAFRLGFGDFHAMFMGDAPVSTEERLVAEYGTRLASDVLKVGHHGSYTSTSEEFLNAVRPQLALVSVGRDNRYGHPNPGVMARLAQHRVRILRTDEHGALVVRARRDGTFVVATQR
jgi:competence protein ComEC